MGARTNFQFKTTKGHRVVLYSHWANDSDEAYRIATDMDIDEFDETGKITLDMRVIA